MSALSVGPHFAHKELLTSRAERGPQKCTVRLFGSRAGNFAINIQLRDAKFWDLFASHKAYARRPGSGQNIEKIWKWQNIESKLSKGQNIKSKISKRQNIERQNIDRQNIERLHIERLNIERQNIEVT